MWFCELTQDAVSTASVAAVRKSNGEQHRKLAHCVPFNALLKDPDDAIGRERDLGLTGGSAISQIAATDGNFAVNGLGEANVSSLKFLRRGDRLWQGR